MQAARFCCASTVCLVSVACTPMVSLLLKVCLSRASDSHVLKLMCRRLRDPLRQPANRFFCSQPERLLCHSSPYRSCFCTQLSGTLALPAHLTRIFCRRVWSLRVLARFKVSVSGILSCYLMCRSLGGQLRKKMVHLIGMSAVDIPSPTGTQEGGQ